MAGFTHKREAVRFHLWLAVIVLAAFALRAWNFDSAGIDHYDEGIYLLSAAALIDGEPIVAGQHFFSPPLYFGVVAASAAATSLPADRVALGLNVLLGALTVLVVGRLGAAWFRPSAGLAAAILLAGNEFHIALSRAALTDTLFSLLFVSAVWLIHRALERDSIPAAALAGIVVGLAWNTKYHGWMSVVVVFAGFAAWRLRQGLNFAALRRAFLLFALITVIATICYLPWALYVESQPGGYAALVEYQRDFLQPNWFANLASQLRQQNFFGGAVTRISMIAAACVVALFESGAMFGPALAAPLIALAIYFAGVGPALCLLAAAGAAALVSQRERPTPWILVSWAAIFLLSTPIYRPYARLYLPFALAAMLLAGVGLSKLAAWVPMQRRLPAALAMLLGLLLALRPDGRAGANPWRDAHDVARAVSEFQSQLGGASKVVVFEEPTAAALLEIAGAKMTFIEGTTDIFAHVTEGDFLISARGFGISLADGDVDDSSRLAVCPVMPKDLLLLDVRTPVEARHILRTGEPFYELRLDRVTKSQASSGTLR